MNIWIINHYASTTFFDEGGRHYSFAKFLKIKGNNPIVFCSNAKHGENGCFFDNSKVWQEKIQKTIDVPYVFVKSRPYIGNGLKRVLNMVDFYRYLKRTASEYVDTKGCPDIIMASSVHPLTLLAGLQLAKKYNVKCICEVRDLWPESLIAYNILSKNNPIVILLRLLEKYVYKHADAIVFTMEGAYDYIIDQGWNKNIPEEKVFFINNGIDLEQYDFNKEHYQIKDSDLENKDFFKVVYTGSIRKVNNINHIIDTAKEIQYPNIRFLIWGDGDELKQLKQRVSCEHIENVIFKGKVEKKYVPYILSKSDLNFAHNGQSSLFKYGISFNKIFDYLAAGRIVLCDFKSKYNPVIEYGAGIESKDYDSKGLAKTIEFISDKSTLELNKYAIAARKTAHKYDFDKLTDELLKIAHLLGVK